MKIRIWGARGSIPAPLEPEQVEEKICQAILGMPSIDTGDIEAVRNYVRQLPPLLRRTAGGNTSCVEIRAGGEIFIIDAGSGLRKLGLELMEGPCGRGEGRLHFFFSHPHWDHIQGFPFLVPAFIPGNEIFIYSIHDLQTALTDQQRSLTFPVPFSYMRAKIEFVTLPVGQPFSIGPVRINTILNAHPGQAYSYRFEDQHSVFVYASDSEYKELDEAGVQPHLEFFQNADALIFDAQYTLKDAWLKVDWGHSSAMIGVDLARAAGVKRLILFHHDPTYSDVQLQEIQATAIAYQAQDTSRPACEVMVAYEGLTLDLTPAGAVDVRLMSDGEAAVLTPISIFDERGVDHLLEQLAQLAAQDASKGSIIDLSQVERLTTAGLKKLVLLSQQREKGSIVLAGPSPEVEQVIKLGGYGDSFAIYPSVEDAFAAVQARQALNLPGQMINERYQIVEKVGEGCLGTVLKVIDMQQKCEAALKILSPTLSVETIDQFANHSHRLLDLDHRHIVGVIDCDWSQEGNHTFVVEEFVTGPTLGELCNRNNLPLSPDEALNIALDIVFALEYAHSLGVIHGDLKPENIFITDEGVKLSGFGLGRLAEGHNLLEAPVLLLTATYLAPEQIMGQPIDARTDLYALGVIFYQLATGLLPFEGSEQEVMRAHLQQAPQSPCELNPRISLSLEHLILKLLAKNPSDRYPGAQQVRRISSSLIIDSAEAIRQRNRVLIGRDKQLQALQSCWHKARRGRGQLAFISGESGVGKTVLAQQAAIQSGNPIVLRGSCEELTESSAYAAFIQILRVYLTAVQPELIDEEAQRLLRNLVRLVPEVRQIWPDLTDPPPLEPEQEQLRLMSSMAQFIIQATQAQPWLLILDDLEWADQASLELLHYLGSHLSTMALLIIGTYHDPLERGHRLLESLRHLSSDPTFHHFPLNCLDLEGVGQLLSQLLRQPAPLNLVEKIYQHTQGNPLYVEELSKSLIDDGHITWQEGRWQVSEVENLRLPRSIHEAIWRRIHRLSPDAQALLRQAAVLGETFKFEDLLEMSGLSKWEVLEQVDMALERHLIQETLGHTRLRFKHAEVHHILYTDMGTLRRSMLHHQAGEALERRSETPEQMAEELAYHFNEGGEFERSLVYSIQAARRAEAIYANEAALKWYNRILEILDKGHHQAAIQLEPLRVSVYEAMASIMKRSGRG